MKSEDETIIKFLTALKADSVRDVKYIGKTLYGFCVCGQPIDYCYKFMNIKNGTQCCVGKTCLKYIFDYIKI